MIGFLRGRIEVLDTKRCLLQTSSGVGYEFFPAGSVLTQTSDQETDIYVVTVVREQEISLYGLATVAEKQFFEVMLGVSGVGPKLALALVSTPIERLQTAISSGNIAVLTEVPGVGKKLAQKIILELKGKLDLSSAPESVTPVWTEAVSALQGLGYDAAQIESVLSKSSESDRGTTEDLITFFLRSQG